MANCYIYNLHNYHHKMNQGIKTSLITSHVALIYHDVFFFQMHMLTRNKFIEDRRTLKHMEWYA